MAVPTDRPIPRSRTASLLTALLVTGAGCLAAGPAAAEVPAGAPIAAPVTLPVDAPRPDYNGDGFADLAVGSGAAVHVLYGTSAGLTRTGALRITAADLGRPQLGTAVFAGSLASGDFDGDGFTDLAVADDGTTVDGETDAGAIVVLYGSASGLSTTRQQYLDRPALGDEASEDDAFGRVMAAGDLGRGTADDLAIGLARSGTGGEVVVVYGSASGLQPAAQRWSQASPGIRGTDEPGDNFGGALTVGDFDGDGAGDLAVGAPGERVGSVSAAGSVHVLFGSAADGLGAARNQAFHRDTPGVKGRATRSAAFGWGLAAGHFAGRDAADLAVVAWADDSVSVLYGSPSGLTTSGDQLWNSGSRGLPRGVLTGDDLTLLPRSTAAGDFGHNRGAGRYDDLAFGVQGALDDGVLVLYGSRTGLTATGSELWSQATRGVPGAAEDSDDFGHTLTAGRYGASRYAALVVGTPNESTAHVYPAGTVHVIRGSGTGLTTRNIQLWDARALGLPPTEDLSFGRALAATGP